MDEDDRFYEAQEGWQEVLKKYPTDLVLVRSDLKIVEHLEDDSSWRKVYSDPQFVVFARSGIDLPTVNHIDAAANGVFP